MKRRLVLFLLAILLSMLAIPVFASGADNDSYRLQRAGMVKEIEDELSFTSERIGK